MSKKTDEPGRGDLVLGTTARYGRVGGAPGFPDAVAEANLESVQPREPARPFAEVPRSLLDHEQQARLIPSPRRSRWCEIERFDERVAEVNAHQRELSEELGRVAEELRTAPERDGDALSTWTLTGEQGPRPEATVAQLEQRQRELQHAVAGMDRRRGEVLAEKVAYVERHRGRLLKEATKAASGARERYEAAIDAARSVRRELEELRQAALWAGLYPDAAPHEYEVPRGICGGLRKPLLAAGLTGPLETDKAFTLLTEDAAWLETAADGEQRAKLEGRELGPENTVWNNTAEGQAWQREQNRKARERYQREWGHDVAEF